MNLGTLRTSFLARGFDYIDASGTTRQDEFINSAYLVDIAEEWPWPDLITTTTGTAPLTITDLRDVIYISSPASGRLQATEYQALMDRDPLFATTTGTPDSWYFTDEGAISVYPADTSSTFTVAYYKVPAVLSTANDEPVLPARVHSLIVDYAVVRAYIDRDNYEAAGQLKQWADMQLAKLAGSVVWKSSDAEFITVAAGSGDW